MHQPGPDGSVTAGQIPNKMQRWVSESDQSFPFYTRLCLIRSSCLSKHWLTSDLSHTALCAKPWARNGHLAQRALASSWKEICFLGMPPDKRQKLPRSPRGLFLHTERGDPGWGGSDWQVATLTKCEPEMDPSQAPLPGPRTREGTGASGSAGQLHLHPDPQPGQGCTRHSVLTQSASEWACPHIPGGLPLAWEKKGVSASGPSTPCHKLGQASPKGKRDMQGGGGRGAFWKESQSQWPSCQGTHRLDSATKVTQSRNGGLPG